MKLTGIPQEYHRNITGIPQEYHWYYTIKQKKFIQQRPGGGTEGEPGGPLLYGGSLQ